MDGSGQMLLLSALLACLCLLAVVAGVAALRDGVSADGPQFSGVDLANARWAQEAALRKASVYYSSAAWDDRASAAAGFAAEANASSLNASRELLRHGIFYRFAFNDSLAAEYVAARQNDSLEHSGGVLFVRNGNAARVLGCAYDIDARGCDAAYRLSRVVIFD